MSAATPLLGVINAGDADAGANSVRRHHQRRHAVRRRRGARVQGGAMIESCFRRMKQTGLKVRPMLHWIARRIEAHVKLCVLALQMQRAAEIRTGLPQSHRSMSQ
jgi:hypothetical protein